MNLQETKEHILRVCNGEPEIMQQAALNVIEAKQSDELVKTWAVNNKAELSCFIELLSSVGSIKNLIDILDVDRKGSYQYMYKQQLIINKNLTEKIKEYEGV